MCDASRGSGLCKGAAEGGEVALESGAIPQSLHLALNDIILRIRASYLHQAPTNIELSGELHGEVPRVIWSYWSQGLDVLPPFEGLCLETWHRGNPGWHLAVLDAVSVHRFLSSDSDLPRSFSMLDPKVQADAVRLALLARYGGVWVDAGIIGVQPLEQFCWNTVSSNRCKQQIVAFDFQALGGKQYVENWFIAARRGHKLIQEWHKLFLELWDDRGEWVLWDHPLFRHVDLSFLRNATGISGQFLTMHACFARLVQTNVQLKRLWQEEMLLMDAEKKVMWHLAQVDWNPNMAEEAWLQEKPTSENETWLTNARSSPCLKFTGEFAEILNEKPLEALLLGTGCFCKLFQELLGRKWEPLSPVPADTHSQADATTTETAHRSPVATGHIQENRAALSKTRLQELKTARLCQDCWNCKIDGHENDEGEWYCSACWENWDNWELQCALVHLGKLGAVCE